MPVIPGSGFSLNVGEIKTRVKRQFGDEVGSQIIDDDIVGWINEAQIEISKQNNLIQKSINADINANQLNYNLPSVFGTNSYVKVATVLACGRALREISQREQADLIGDPSNSINSGVSGNPAYFWMWGTTLNLYPIPTIDQTGGLLIYYTQPPDDLANDTDISPLPAIYHMDIVNYCIAKAKEQDDDAAGYQQKMSEFNAGVSANKDIEEWRELDLYPSISTSVGDFGYSSEPSSWGVYN